MLSAKKNKKSPLKTTFLVIVPLIAVGIYLVVASQAHLWPFVTSEPVNLDTPSVEEKSAGDKIKSDAITSPTETTSSSKDQPASTTNPATSGPTVSVDVVSYGVNGTSYRVGILIGGTLASGSCTLDMVGPSGQKLTFKTDVYAQASTSTCKDFGIAKSQLSNGPWSLTASVVSGTTTGSTTQTIEVTL